jgi:hypothetical protein
MTPLRQSSRIHQHIINLLGLAERGSLHAAYHLDHPLFLQLLFRHSGGPTTWETHGHPTAGECHGERQARRFKPRIEGFAILMPISEIFSHEHGGESDRLQGSEILW